MNKTRILTLTNQIKPITFQSSIQTLRTSARNSFSISLFLLVRPFRCMPTRSHRATRIPSSRILSSRILQKFLLFFLRRCGPSISTLMIATVSDDAVCAEVCLLTFSTISALNPCSHAFEVTSTVIPPPSSIFSHETLSAMLTMCIADLLRLTGQGRRSSATVMLARTSSILDSQGALLYAPD